MLLTPNCYIRNCKYFQGAKRLGITEDTEVVYCDAYPQGIPSDIAYGDDLHLEVREDQDNNIVYEEAE